MAGRVCDRSYGNDEPMEQQTLLNCLRQMDSLVNQEFADLVKLYTDDDITYRIFVYVISAVWGWRFVRDVLNISVENLDYDAQEEKINFLCDVLKRTSEVGAPVHEADSVWNAVDDFFEEINDIEALTKG